MSGTSRGVIPPPYRNTPYENPVWVMFIDPDSGNTYFYNTETSETSWEDPSPPVGASLYQEVLNVAGAASKSVDTEEFLDEVEKNFYLKVEIDREIDRGTPPYLSEDWRTRPARKQAERDTSKFSYKEGSEFYNIWYHKYTGDRFDGTIREAASTICDPWSDSGWTEGDKKNSETPVFCLWFAKGCCTKGPSCRYKHHIPTREVDRSLDQMIDVFGRERHASHKDDMGGVGSFMKECKCLYVSEIQIDREQPDCIQRLEAQMWKLFHPWGPIESIRIIPNKLIAFIKFEYRAAAEFAKVACADQPVGLSKAINVRWAFEDPNPRAALQSVIDTRDQFFALVEKRISSMSFQERAERGLLDNAEHSKLDLEDRFEVFHS
jgi:hypothetical protein